LGDLTDEYPDDEIVEYCSGGAKQYGLKLKKKNSTDNQYNHVLKVRGMTLSHDVIENQHLCYETFKERVIKYVKECDLDPIPILYPNFIRPSIPQGSVISVPMQKIYKPYVGKGIVRPNNFNVLDFGYIK